MKLLLSIPPTDKPLTPSLTASVREPTVGDTIILTCNSATAGVTSYHFFKDGSATAFFTTTVGNSHTIASANLINDDARYTCKAFIDSVGSDPSNPLDLKGKNVSGFIFHW